MELGSSERAFTVEHDEEPDHCKRTGDVYKQGSIYDFVPVISREQNLFITTIQEENFGL